MRSSSTESLGNAPIKNVLGAARADVLQQFLAGAENVGGAKRGRTMTPLTPDDLLRLPPVSHTLFVRKAYCQNALAAQLSSHAIGVYHLPMFVYTARTWTTHTLTLRARQ